MIRILFVFISIMSILSACVDECEINSDQEAISKLMKKYPELGKDTVGAYHLTRTVIIENRNVAIKLYSSEHTLNASHQIILIHNAKGENYAIPMFSNDVRKYWNFENEEKTYTSTSYHSLFEKEYVLAINRLKINDTSGTGYAVLFEIFHSLLHFQEVNELDRAYLEELGNRFTSSNAHSDDDQESETRNKLNCDQVLSSIIKNDCTYSYTALFDSKNYRVFQMEFPEKRTKKIDKLNIKIYRFGRDVQLLFL